MKSEEHGKGRFTFFLFAYWHDKNYKGFLGGNIKIWELAENLAKLGQNVLLFMPDYALLKQRPAFKVVRIPIVDIGLLRPICFNVLAFVMSCWYGLRNKVHVVYMRRFSSIVPLVFSKVAGATFIYEVNDDPYLGYESYSKTKWFFVKRIERINLVHSDRINVVTERIRKRLHRKFNVPLDKMAVIPSCSNTSMFRPMNRQQCLDRIGLDPDKRYVGFIGTFIKVQGPHILIEATSHILNAYPEAMILMVGDGVMRKDLEYLTRKKGLESHVIFTGQVPYPEAAAYINAMDVGTSPFLRTYGETVAVKVYDTLACGRPMVSSDFAKTRNDTSQTGGVIYVEPENPVSLAEGVIKLLSDDNLRSRMGARGREVVVDYFDRERVAKEIVDMTSEIRAGNGS
jgi:glycosyltransferase involved in cell wall biosynthesis